MSLHGDRLQIYESLGQQRTSEMRLIYPTGPDATFSVFALAITQVNRQVRDESLPVLYRGMNVMIHVGSGSSLRQAARWLEVVDEKALASINSFRVVHAVHPAHSGNIVSVNVDLTNIGEPARRSSGIVIHREKVDANMRRVVEVVVSLRVMHQRLRDDQGESSQLDRLARVGNVVRGEAVHSYLRARGADALRLLLLHMMKSYGPQLRRFSQQRRSEDQKQLSIA